MKYVDIDFSKLTRKRFSPKNVQNVVQKVTICKCTLHKGRREER